MSDYIGVLEFRREGRTLKMRTFDDALTIHAEYDSGGYLRRLAFMKCPGCKMSKWRAAEDPELYPEDVEHFVVCMMLERTSKLNTYEVLKVERHGTGCHGLTTWDMKLEPTEREPGVLDRVWLS